MTPAPGQITIDFTSNHTLHRICYRKTTDPPGVYTCIENIACGGGGAPCSYTFILPTDLDDETCDTVTYEGYVQASCQDVASIIGRVPWTCTFTPAEDCYSALIECVEVDLDTITLTDPGTGYDPLNPPNVTIDGCPPLLAAATAYVADDGVETLTISDQGAGVMPADNVYHGIAQIATTGAGSGAVFQVTISGGVITDISIDYPTLEYHHCVGTGYVDGDVEEVTLDTVGGTRTGIKATVTTIFASGILLEVLVDVTDTFTVIPAITIDAPVMGDTATAEANMLPCDKFTVTECDGGASAFDLQLELNQSTIICGEHPSYPFAFVPADYDQSHSGCCYDCHSLSFVNNEGTNVTLSFLDCETGEWTQHTLTPAVMYTKCVTDGAYYFTPAASNVTVVVGAECYPVP